MKQFGNISPIEKDQLTFKTQTFLTSKKKKKKDKYMHSACK